MDLRSNPLYTDTDADPGVEATTATAAAATVQFQLEETTTKSADHNNGATVTRRGWKDAINVYARQGKTKYLEQRLCAGVKRRSCD